MEKFPMMYIVMFASMVYHWRKSNAKTVEENETEMTIPR